jgi:peptidoglycan/LPS O-acetylase OafA/YrhL
LDALTSLRFFAAAMILVYHMSITFKFSETTLLSKLALWQGVTFFFVLSGFILAYVYPQLPTELSARQFLFARFAKVWPTHCLTLILCIVVCLSGDVEGGWTVLIVNLLALQSWTLDLHYWFALNSASWSISVEFFFYLCFPLLVKSFDKTWRQKLLFGFGLAMLSVMAMMYLQFSTVGLFYAGSFNQITVNPLCRLFEFIIGMCTALAFKNFRNILPTARNATLIEAAAIAGAAVALALPFNWHCPGWLSFLEPLRAWLYFGGVAPLYGALIYVVACAKGKISQWLSSSILVHLGEISFSLYMIHGIVLGWFSLHERYFENWTLWQKVSCSTVLCLLLAKITYQLFEAPCQAFLIKLSKGNRPSVTEMVAFSKLPMIEISVTLMIIGGLGLVTKFWRSDFNPISSAHAREMIIKENFQVQNILFGNQFYLRASRQYSDENGLHIALIWESTRRQRLDYLTNVTALDEAGGQLSSEAYPQASSLAVVKAGKMWLEKIDLDPLNPNRRRISSVLISVVGEKDERLYVQNGARDATNRQFVLALSGP